MILNTRNAKKLSYSIAVMNLRAFIDAGASIYYADNDKDCAMIDESLEKIAIELDMRLKRMNEVDSKKLPR